MKRQTGGSFHRGDTALNTAPERRGGKEGINDHANLDLYSSEKR